MTKRQQPPYSKNPYVERLRRFAGDYRAGVKRDWTALRAYLHSPRWKRDRRWLVFIPALGIIAIAAMYASIAASLTPPEQVILGAKGVEILDRNGQIIHAFDDEPGSSRIVPLGEISPYLIDATIATEDADFWNNPGVNVKGLARAFYENVAFWENGGFFKGSGGSSLSQQLAKNLYIKPEERVKRSPIRKIKETIIAFELNRRYSKEQLLQWYLSNIFYGHGSYGIESASYRYLNKPPKDLTLAEAALLAGIPRGPTLYDPIANYDAAVERQQQVLSLMVRHGSISQQDADAAIATPVALREGHNPNQAGDSDDAFAIHFSLYVRELLPLLLGRDKVDGRQLRVTTTLDSSLQTKAETALKTNLDRLEPQVGATNGALVAMDPKTGEVLAMVGSHDFFRDEISGQVNSATALNQPGSTIKSVTYLAAFMKGWLPSTPIVDEPIKLSTGESTYTLGNADLRYRGQTTARVALGSSLNVPAVKTLEYAGLPQVHALARRMGLSDLKEVDAYGPAFTLGVMDVSLLDMTYVFSVLANEGEQSGMSSVLGLPKGSRTLDPVAVLKVETVDGKVLWQAKERKERITPANVTYLVTNILSDDNARSSMFGLGSPLTLPGRPVAAKSGLSDDARDAWTLGYTPQLVTGVWVGNANNKPMPGATSTFTAAPIWNAFMRTALEGKPVIQFNVPEGVQVVGGEVYLTAHGNAPTPTQAPASPTATPETSPTTTPTPQTSPTPKASPSTTPTRTPTVPASQTPTPVFTPTRTPTPRPNATSTPSPLPTQQVVPQSTAPPVATATATP